MSIAGLRDINLEITLDDSTDICSITERVKDIKVYDFISIKVRAEKLNALGIEVTHLLEELAKFKRPISLYTKHPICDIPDNIIDLCIRIYSNCKE